MKLEPKTRLGPLLEEYPFLIDFLAGYAPYFKVIRNPVMRKTVARAATLAQAAKLGGVEVESLLGAVAAAISEETGEEVSFAAGPRGAEVTPADEEARLRALKDIILSLHEGGDPEDARRRFAEVIRDVSPAEISAMEQRLMAEGLPPEEVKRLCDVHVRVFKESLERREAAEVVPGHPVDTFRRENEAVAVVAARIRETLDALGERPRDDDFASRRQELEASFARLAEFEKHYVRKENQLFPLLERHDVSGPTQVMWALHDDIRAMLRETRRALAQGEAGAFVAAADKLLTAVDDMIYKEEKILFPMALETLSTEEWREVRRGEEEIGYALAEPAAPWPPEDEGAPAPPPAAPKERETLSLDTGALTPEQVNLVLKHLPVDITFVDEEDTVRYYSATAERIFPRSPAVIGRKVQNCHPPKSLHAANRLLEEFKAGERDVAEFWIRQGEKFVHIRYFALRDVAGNYRGTMEVSQEVSGVRALEGERRLLDS
ncbi:MAG: DUF438 domain-containing protein [bacterium]